MQFRILESREASGYADSASSYEFPSQYLSQFDPVAAGEPIAALIYEPGRSGGRKAFVGWVVISTRPVRQENGLWRVDFDHPIWSFDNVVPLSTDGIAAEHRLREWPRAEWGRHVHGKAVRPISASNAEEILQLGAADTAIAPQPPASALDLAPEARARQLVERLKREAGFRDAVLEAFNFRCAVTGLTAGRKPASRLFRCVDAAHIRPVGKLGPDVVQNGVLLTPTVHRLFDACLFGLERRRNKIVVVCSPHLSRSMLTSDRTSTNLALTDGHALTLPDDPALQPAEEFLEFHRTNVFKRLRTG